MNIDKIFAAIMLIEILYERGLVNEATYNNVKKFQKSQFDMRDSHISQIV